MIVPTIWSVGGSTGTPVEPPSIPCLVCPPVELGAWGVAGRAWCTEFGLGPPATLRGSGSPGTPVSGDGRGSGPSAGPLRPRARSSSGGRAVPATTTVVLTGSASAIISPWTAPIAPKSAASTRYIRVRTTSRSDEPTRGERLGDDLEALAGLRRGVRVDVAVVGLRRVVPATNTRSPTRTARL
jgi:hypothetical protein